MSTPCQDKLVIAVSSRALFDLDASNAIFENEGVEAYAAHQVAHENTILKPGQAFPLIKKLTHLNRQHPFIEIILLSRNSADTGLRIFNSIAHYDLAISRAAFTNGQPPYRYAAAFDTDLFLSTHEDDVRAAIASGYAAATILSSSTSHTDDLLRIAFDGDAVLFSNESEAIFQSQGIDAFTKNEQAAANTTLTPGPFHAFLSAIHTLQAHSEAGNCPIKTALVTARQAPAHERVIRSLRDWGIRIDECLFLGGLPKGPFLKAFQADIFFDDQLQHCQSASEHVLAAHVPNAPLAPPQSNEPT
jgi:5'-nucleotidase